MGQKYYFIFFILLFTQLFFLGSCAQSKKEKRENAIHSAKIYLTNRLCDDALFVLQDVGGDGKDAKYNQTLASAYACKASYSEINFFGKDLSKLSGTSTDSLIGSLTTFTTSEMTSPTDSKFTYLMTAINTLIYAGEVSEPSVAKREEIFSEDESLDISIQALYMIFVELGKFAFYYGNADPTLGKKGTGAAANGNFNNLTNGCFYNYDPTTPAILAYITALKTAASLGSCTNAATSHPQLIALPNANTITRMCQGIILFNQFLDILLNTEMPQGAEDLTTLGSTFADVLSAVPAGVGNIVSVKSQTDCEANYGVGSETDKLQLYFFFIYETLFK